MMQRALAASAVSVCRPLFFGFSFETRNCISFVPLKPRRLFYSTDLENPLVNITGLPKYGLIKDEHVVPAMTYLLDNFDKEFKDLESQWQEKLSGNKQEDVTWADVMNALEVKVSKLSLAWGTVSHLLSVRNSDALRKANEEIEERIVKTFAKVGQSKSLYNAYQTLLSDKNNLDPVQKRILEQAVLSADLSGAKLEGETKEKFNALNVELSSLSTKFGNNVLDSTKAYQKLLTEKSSIEGLPNSVLGLMSQNAHAQGMSNKADTQNGPWLVSLDFPCFGPLMKYAKDPTLREEVYKANVERASKGEHDNQKILTKILEIRAEKSQILGYENYATQSLANKMASSPEEVNKMISDLHKSSFQVAKQEIEDLQIYANENGHSGPLHLWDVPFYSNLKQESLFSIDEEKLRPYFPLPSVLKGMFNLANELFDVVITKAEVDNSLLWHKDVELFDVSDKHSGKLIAQFFMDPYSRPSEKRGGAWVNTAVDRSTVVVNEGETVRLPVAHLVCNQSPGVDGKPSLMTFREVETMFHEFGHALQHMLTTIDYSGAAGLNNIEWDAVELPSQFMENWCYHKPTVDQISSHVDTKEKLPDQIFSNLLLSRNYMSGSNMLRQLFFAKVDMALHEKQKIEENPLITLRNISEDYTILRPLESDRFLCSFSHIFQGGYAAGYYSYKWAEVLSQDAYSIFEENPNDTKALGRQFRDTVLSLGGSKPAMEVFRSFRGRDPDPRPLLRTYGLL